MYILSDEALNELLGGEYYQVIIAKKECPDLSIAQLYNFQFDYFSYQGFRKFYRKHLEPIIKQIHIIDDDSIVGKAIKWLLNAKR